MKRKIKITFNAPVVLGFAAICFIATLLNYLTNGKQRFTRGYKRYKETSGLIEWKKYQIFHSIFT